LHGGEFYSFDLSEGLPFLEISEIPKTNPDLCNLQLSAFVFLDVIFAVQHSETTVDVDHVDQVSQAPFVDLVCKPWTHNLERLVQRWIDETPLATRLKRGVCLGGFTGKPWTRDTWEDTVEEESVFHSFL